jgi:RNA polymerase sigma factor, sigma-70 family
MQDFEEIYTIYSKQVFGYLMSLTDDIHLSEEISQETFYRAYKNIKSFNGNCKLSVWLCAIAKNCLIDHFRKQKKYKEVELTESILSGSIIVDDVERNDTYRLIQKAIHKLKEPYKEVFMLKQFSGLSLKDIAGIFSKTESWARVTYYRAKNQLKDRLEEWGVEI